MTLIREGVKSLTVNGRKLILLPEKALFFEEERALILADPHLGKTAHFRKSGIPIPNGADGTNYEVLDRLIDSYPINKIYILGDLFHSDKNQEWHEFTRWLKHYPKVQLYLIQGNHDILPDATYQEAGLIIYDHTYLMGSFLLSHKPLRSLNDSSINLSGHIHPGIQLRGKGRQSLKLPCFHWNEQKLILPAFGRFTGTSPVITQPTDRVFAVAEEQVFEV